MTKGGRPPLPALLLGYGGLLPAWGAVGFAMLHGGPYGSGPRGTAVIAGLAYGALILSFLGGIWWGVAVAKLEGAAQRGLLATAVMPQLVAAAILCLLPYNLRAAGGLMAMALVATLLGDRRLAAWGLVPAWWLALRVPLSVGLGAAMLALAALG